MNNRFLEAGAALLFFGTLLQQYPELPAIGAKALQKLAERGCRVPTEAQPVRVYAAQTIGNFSTQHGAGWRPGAIYLRTAVQGNASISV